MNTHPLEDLSKLYLSEKDITSNSKDLYRTILKQYIAYLREHQIVYAKTSDVNRYIEEKRNQNYSSHWIYQQINAIKGLYRYLSQNQKRLDLSQAYVEDITEGIKNERIHLEVSKPVLTIKEARQLILCTKEKRKYIWHYRDHAMLYLMMTTGMRSIEIRRAKKKDLSQINGQMILYIQGKGRTSADDYVKITPGVNTAINDYLEKRKDDNPFLFISHSKHSDQPYLSRTFFIRMFRRVLKTCGLSYTKITPHSLRHSVATMNLLRGGSLEDTKRLMRHAKLSTTLIYAHHLEDNHDDSGNQIERYILNESKFNYSDIYIIFNL